MSDVFRDSAASLRELSLHHDAALVMYSGGKDSLATMDLCCRAFRTVVGVFMYFVPGLAVAEERLDFARKRWGVEFLLLPHWGLTVSIQTGVYCRADPDMPLLKLPDIHRLARNQTGIDLIAHGAKNCDGSWRRRQMKATADRNLLAPLAAWNKWDVMAYLQERNIPLPGEKFDIGLGMKSLYWLHDHHPADFDRVEEVFPYVRAAIKRREYYGEEV